jgi:hypothetical protein
MFAHRANAVVATANGRRPMARGLSKPAASRQPGPQETSLYDADRIAGDKYPHLRPGQAQLAPE